VHGGGGYDKVETYLQCDYIRPEFFATEVVRITGFDSVEEGPCN
jgi:hypothetical protein